VIAILVTDHNKTKTAPPGYKKRKLLDTNTEAEDEKQASDERNVIVHRKVPGFDASHVSMIGHDEHLVVI
jgi:hypothetical protein